MKKIAATRPGSFANFSGGYGYAFTALAYSLPISFLALFIQKIIVFVIVRRPSDEKSALRSLLNRFTIAYVTFSVLTAAITLVFPVLGMFFPVIALYNAGIGIALFFAFFRSRTPSAPSIGLSRISIFLASVIVVFAGVSLIAGYFIYQYSAENLYSKIYPYSVLPLLYGFGPMIGSVIGAAGSYFAVLHWGISRKSFLFGFALYHTFVFLCIVVSIFFS